jgi:hypothetical protein
MPIAALVAFSLFGFLLIGGIILAIVLVVAAIWKMRKDDFWEEPMG